MADDFTHADARAMRRCWFTFLDTVEPVHGNLYGYCLKLTGNVWDGEDLLQDTLLRGFAMTARGDFHGPASPVRDARTYLFRTATNLWLDRLRRAWPFAAGEAPEAVSEDPDLAAAGEALALAVTATSAREFAALVLKEGYGFTLEEIADFMGTTVGTVKSALSRGRRKLRETTSAAAVDEVSRAVVEAFVAALNGGDVDAILGLMAETVKIDVCNVGGGRGRSGVWTEKTLAGLRCAYAEHDGAPLVLLFGAGDDDLTGVVRVEHDAGIITRVVDYHYAPETLTRVAAALGLRCRPRGHHQVDELPAMVATTALPWRAEPVG